MLKTKKTHKTDFPYLDTPAGIITPRGHTFRTNEQMLQTYAGPLFEEHSVESMLKKAVTWIESTDGFGILVSLLALLLLPLPAAVGLTLILAGAWHYGKTAFAGPALNGFVRVMQYDIAQFLVAIAPLSWFGMEEMYGHLMAGIVFFVAFKFGWIRMLANRLSPDEKAADKPGPNDRVLNMLLMRYAIKEGITLPNLKRMEAGITEAMRKSEQQRKSWRKKSSS